jgi:hypothetical protein
VPFFSVVVPAFLSPFAFSLALPRGPLAIQNVDAQRLVSSGIFAGTQLRLGLLDALNDFVLVEVGIERIAARPLDLTHTLGRGHFQFGQPSCPCPPMRGILAKKVTRYSN